MTKAIVEKESKRRFALWVRQSTLDGVIQWYELDNCSSQSEFIEKAILFYVGYLSSDASQEYLAKNITSLLRATINESENRIARVIFKLTVELSMLMNIIAATHSISQNQLRELRATCVDEVKRTNGAYNLKDAMKMQER